MDTVIDLEEEKKEILSRYRKLLRVAKPFLKDNDAKLIKKAFNFSLEAHKEMRRKSGEPYIFHPIAVAMITVEEIGLGTTSIISALLHDVVEDTDFEIPDIEREFGTKVARIIDGLTKISGTFEQGSSQQAENFKKMLLTLSDDVRVVLIKLADRLHNMRTLDSMPRHKQLKIASETIYIYAPLAHRLGLYAIKTELEDLYLKYTNPEIYKEIASKISQTKIARDKFIKDFISPIQRTIKEQGFNNFKIFGRPKSIYSIWSKMQRQNIPFEEVYDLFAIRIILDVPLEMEKSACWRVYSIITDTYNPSPDRLRDWVSTPKSNGYESLHTTVMSKTGQWVEVQIRTERMDQIAEKGFAAHWKYKSRSEAESAFDAWINKIRELLENNDKGSAIEFLDDFRSNLYNEEIYAFTPKGEMKTLPIGSTVLDFAFEVHSDIGMKCIGGKVNQKLVPLSYQLKNGDQVEILTSNKQSPTDEWMGFVNTSKAKTKIKEYIREERKLQIEIGKNLVDRKLEEIGWENNTLNLHKFCLLFDITNFNDLYYQVSNGLFDLVHVDKSLVEKLLIEKEATLQKKLDDEVNEKILKKDDLLLIGEEIDKINYSLAKCCNPIAGDEVFGFVGTDNSIQIHRASCKKGIELMSRFGNKIVKAKWNAQEIAFLAGIKLSGTDRVGIVNDITKVISNELKVNMRSIMFESEDGIFKGEVMVYVHDTRHLDTLINKLNKVNGIVSATRFD